MAIKQVVECDLCHADVEKSARLRIAVRRNEDRPDAAEFIDVGPCCVGERIAALVKIAESRWPEADYPHPPPGSLWTESAHEEARRVNGY